MGVGSYASSVQSYGYDSLNRLTSVVEQKYLSAGGGLQAAFTQAYTYDHRGNRQIDAATTTNTLNEAQFEMGEAATNNRLLAPGDMSRAESARWMRYDAAGNLTTDIYTGAETRTYDAENRMTQQLFTRGMATTFGDERLARFTAQTRRVIEFREEPPSARAHSGLRQLGEPRLALPHLIHLSSGARDGGVAVESFDPVHDAR